VPRRRVIGGGEGDEARACSALAQVVVVVVGGRVTPRASMYTRAGARKHAERGGAAQLCGADVSASRDGVLPCPSRVLRRGVVKACVLERRHLLPTTTNGERAALRAAGPCEGVRARNPSEAIVPKKAKHDENDCDAIRLRSPAREISWWRRSGQLAGRRARRSWGQPQHRSLQPELRALPTPARGHSQRARYLHSTLRHKVQRTAATVQLQLEEGPLSEYHHAPAERGTGTRASQINETAAPLVATMPPPPPWPHISPPPPPDGWDTEDENYGWDPYDPDWDDWAYYPFDEARDDETRHAEKAALLEQVVPSIVPAGVLTVLLIASAVLLIASVMRQWYRMAPSAPPATPGDAPRASAIPSALKEPLTSSTSETVIDKAPSLAPSLAAADTPPDKGSADEKSLTPNEKYVFVALALPSYLPYHPTSPSLTILPYLSTTLPSHLTILPYHLTVPSHRYVFIALAASVSIVGEVCYGLGVPVLPRPPYHPSSPP
jgi:hypothetical protein